MGFRIYLLIPKIKRERFEMFGFLLRIFDRSFGPILEVILRNIIAFRFFAIFPKRIKSADQLHSVLLGNFEHRLRQSHRPRTAQIGRQYRRGFDPDLIQPFRHFGSFSFELRFGALTPDHKRRVSAAPDICGINNHTHLDPQRLTDI